MTERTPDALRAQAHTHYSAMKDWNCRMHQKTAEEAAFEEQFSKDLLEAVLATPADQLLDLDGWLQAQSHDKSALALVMSATPYMMGTLQLLDMEFANAAVGVIPLTEIRELLKSKAPLMYQGVELTEANVHIQFRRKPLLLSTANVTECQ